MTELTFTANSIYTDSKAYESLIQYFNQIAKIGENKKFEWEDEELPEKEYNIGTDFQKWIDCIAYDHQRTLELEEEQGPAIGRLKITPEKTVELFEPIKEYFDGFIYSDPTGIYEGQVFINKHKKAKSYEELVDFCKELRQNNETVLIRRVYEDTYKPIISGDVWNTKSELVYGEEITLYCLSYMNFSSQDTPTTGTDTTD